LCADAAGGVARGTACRYVRSMPRPLRIEEPGAIYHVTCRGNRKQPIYLDANDRVFFLRWLNRVALEDEWEVVSYVQMTNHFHGVIHTPKPNLSHGMQRLTGTYGQFFNHLHGLTGHVFQGRFHSRRIESEAQFVECAAYDDLNPVRAGIVDHPLEWRWSSCRATVGLEPKLDCMNPRLLLRQFGPDIERARQEYLAFLELRLEQRRVA
jgi:putative transposase